MCAAIGAASFDPGPNAGTKPCRVPPIQVSTLPPNSLFFIAFLHGCAAHGVTSRGIIDRHSQPAVITTPAYHGTDSLRQIVEHARDPHGRRRHDDSLYRPSPAARSHQPTSVRRPEAGRASGVAHQRES